MPIRRNSSLRRRLLIAPPVTLVLAATEASVSPTISGSLKMWKFFVTYRDGSATFYVPERDRAQFERQTEGNLGVMRYSAEPLAQYA